MRQLSRLLPVLAAALVLGSAAGASEPFAIGGTAPDFELPDQAGQLHSLEDYRDRWVVLFFYPKDHTPGCTTEVCQFRDNIFAFREANAQILGISLDDVESHREFAEQYELPFPLLADIDGKAAAAYGVVTRMLGMRLAKRETFLVDPLGRVAKHYTDVNPATHAQEVLADLETLIADARISAAP
jgi:peroxiredoxin Q/BCP